MTDTGKTIHLLLFPQELTRVFILSYFPSKYFLSILCDLFYLELMLLI